MKKISKHTTKFFLTESKLSVHCQMLIFLKGWCKENGPRAIWLSKFWCLMINTICGLTSFLVFMFVVHRMQELLGLRN
jgi:hypothetical protein